MADQDSKIPELNVQNHLAIDERMDCWSPWGLDLSGRRFPAHQYVNMCLELSLGNFVPEEIRSMFDRAKSVMSYGVYHYPLFTAGDESVALLFEASIYHFAMQNGCTLRKDKATFGKLLEFCEKRGFLKEPQLRRWQACREIRNSVAHQKRLSLQGPNGAVTSLSIAKELIEALFVYGPPDYTRFYRESAEFETTWNEVKKLTGIKEF